MSGNLDPARRRRLFWLLLALLAVRLATLGAYPLTDTTEARYGEIARKMAETSDWVTPWFDWGVPFWGKPPLAFWLSAASTKLLGTSELSVRLPSFLLGLGMLGLVWTLARREVDGDAGLVAATVLASSCLFFVCSGAVLTDMALAFAVTLAMAGFWLGTARTERQATLWGYAGFAGLGLGLLAKGPVALVLILAPLVAWAIINRPFRASMRTLPWVGGTAVLLLIAVPWYVLAELRTPGFLRYFLLGENFARFIDPTWTGDLYGGVHTEPRGFIWLLWLGSAFPWSIVLLVGIVAGLWGRGGAWALLVRGRRFFTAAPWRLYLLLFAFAPAILFTFAGSVLPTYLLPGTAALALLLAEVWRESAATVPRSAIRGLAIVAALVPFAFAVALPLFNGYLADDRSQKRLLVALPGNAEVIYFPRRPFSGQFYTAGRAVQATEPEALGRRLALAPDAYVVTRAGNTLPAHLASRYRPVSESGRRKRSVLWAPVATDPVLPGIQESGSS